MIDGHIEAIVSPMLLAELARVLGREKFSAFAAEGRAEAFIALIAERATLVEDAAPASGLTDDPDDDYLVALGLANRVDAVVSGDRHLLATPSEVLPACTPRALVDRLDLTTG